MKTVIIFLMVGSFVGAIADHFGGSPTVYFYPVLFVGLSVIYLSLTIKDLSTMFDHNLFETNKLLHRLYDVAANILSQLGRTR